MRALITSNETWSPTQFFNWVASYLKVLPKSQKIIISIDHPLHQLAALYAALAVGKTALSTSKDNLSNMQEVFDCQEVLAHKEDLCLETFKGSPESFQGELAIATSGSSGTPKIVILSVNALLASAKASCDFYQINSNDIIASPLPLHHVGGILPFWRMIVSQCSLVLATDHWQQACTNNATQLSLVPTQLKVLLNQGFDWSSYKSVILGAQALDPALFNLAIKAGCPISVSYGSSESVAQLSATIPGTEPEGSVGMLLGDREVKIINGKIAFKGRATFSHYIDHGKNILPFNNDGFFETNDLGYFDAQGKLYVQGRSDHIFKSGGENINPATLEKRLLNKSSIDELFILPIEDPDFGSLTAAAITPFNQKTISTIVNENLHLLTHEKIRFACALPSPTAALKRSRTYETKRINKNYKSWNVQRLGPKHTAKDNMIFLHGFMGQATHMHTLAAKFANDFNVWGVDLPYHGDNLTQALSWDSILDSLASVLLRFNNLWIYGYSMGGRLVYGLLDRYPQLIKYAVAESAHPGLKSDLERSQRIEFEQNIITKMTQTDFKTFLANWYRADLFKLDEESITQLQKMTAPSPQLYAKALQTYGLSSQPNLSHLLSHPNLLTVTGEGDQKYQDLLPDSLSIADCAHKASFQRPEAVYRQLIEYFKSHSWL
tara:strand:+ start:24210 stop:26201 length:1992 start_codon:yes stop_codon:yes gene_type:complete